MSSNIKRKRLNTKKAEKKIAVKIGSVQTYLKSKPAVPDITCSYYKECLQVQKMINLPETLLDNDSKFNKCYCQTCYANHGEEYSYRDGPAPHNLYTKPVGWGRIMLKLPPRADHLKIFSDWNVAFHGTSPDKLLHIVEGGTLLLPGDKTMSGDTVKEVDEHYNDKRKPDDFDTKQVFLSPSIKYAGCEVYAKKRRLHLSSSDRYVFVRTVLEVRVKPDHFEVGPQTVGRSDPIDAPIDNDTIKWSTSARNSVIPTAVLIQVLESPGPMQSETVCPTCKVIFGDEDRFQNYPSKRTCRHKHVVCLTCSHKFKDIYGDTCVLCSEPTYYQVDESEEKAIRERASSYAKAHDRLCTSGRGKKITIYVKTLTGKTITLQVRPTISVYHFKRHIQEDDGVPPDMQLLRFKGLRLKDDDMTLQECGLSHEDIVYMMLNLSGD